MTPSIRTFLIVNLLLSVTVIASLAIIGNLFLEHKDIQKHLDGQLHIIARTISAFTKNTADLSHFTHIQKAIHKMPYYTALPQYASPISHRLSRTMQNIQFQVWLNKKLLLVSDAAKHLPFRTQPAGFSNWWKKDESWRVFAYTDPDTHYKIIVAQRHDFRKVVETRITEDSITVMLLTYPFLGILIWIIVGQGLTSLRQIAKALRSREPNNLKALSFKSIPPEIQPLIDELNSLFQRLKDTFAREKRFAADAAHELKTPLAAIKMQAQVALSTANPDEQLNALHKLIKGVDRSTHVVNQLLTLSRMEPDTGLKSPKVINLCDVAINILSELGPYSIDKNITLAFHPEKDSIYVKGDSVYLGILIRNLVDNALRYTPEGGTVDVMLTHTKGGKPSLSVIDSGPGIPKAKRKRVFERFYRILGNKATGSGLGLGIVQKIAELHRAKLTLSTPSSGKGLEVQIIFPATISRK